MKPSKNIDWLFVLPDDLIGGGAQQVMFHMVNYLVDNGYDCAVLFLVKKTHHGWQSMESKCHIIYLNYDSVYLGYFGAIKFLKSFLKTHTVINIISSQVLVNGLLGFLKYLNIIHSNSKLILRESTSVFLRFKGVKRFIYKMAYQMGYKQADVIICQTHLMKNQLITALKWLNNHKNLIVLPNPVDIKDMTLKGLKTPSVEIEEDYIVAAGRIIPEKGFNILIQAFAGLNNQSLKLLILGTGEDHIVQELKTLSKNLNISEQVIFLGFVDNVFPFFKRAKLCVISSIIEGFPNTLLQMMSQNTKVVSTLCAGGISEIKGLTTCPPNDTNALKKAIKNCLDKKYDSSIKTAFDIYLEKRAIDFFMKKLLKTLNTF